VAVAVLHSQEMALNQVEMAVVAQVVEQLLTLLLELQTLAVAVAVDQIVLLEQQVVQVL
jgi:hypothetical protein